MFSFEIDHRLFVTIGHSCLIRWIFVTINQRSWE